MRSEYLQMLFPFPNYSLNPRALSSPGLFWHRHGTSRVYLSKAVPKQEPRGKGSTGIAGLACAENSSSTPETGHWTQELIYLCLDLPSKLRLHELFSGMESSGFLYHIYIMSGFSDKSSSACGKL